MATYLTPGVYVEEVSGGPKPISMVGTSTAAFLGIAPKSDAFAGAARTCLNWTQFVTDFAGGDSKATPLALAINGYFQNGGSRCYVVNLAAGDLDAGLRTLDALDDVAIVCAPGLTAPGEYDAVLSHCERLGDRVAVLDAPIGVKEIEPLAKVATIDKDGAAVGGLRPRSSDGGYGAVYFPPLIVRNPFDPKVTTTVPPSGHIAGIYARTDTRRGVHKAPANEVVVGAIGVERLVTREEQGVLNRAGVNVIRSFPDQGIKVWGARTLADEASEWRYVNVRRLVNMIKESIENGTRWTVFEPNDPTLWKSIERNVRAFLTQVWRQGALFGETPEQAFFVRCDAEVNPPESVDAGHLITEIGIAPVKPAEFIIFRLGLVSGDASEGQ